MKKQISGLSKKEAVGLSLIILLGTVEVFGVVLTPPVAVDAIRTGNSGLLWRLLLGGVIGPAAGVALVFRWVYGPKSARVSRERRP